MFYVNNNPILADELEILKELKNQLHLNGIELFNQFIRTGKNIQFNCPIHKDGKERKPSCGILTQNQEQIPSGTVHCFTCGYTASLEEMISHCFGKNDNGRFGKDWLIKNFLTIKIEERKDIDLNFSRETEQQKINYVTEKELEKYRFYHPYMYKRKLTDEIIEKFDVGYDKHFELKNKFNEITNVFKCLTFPVRNEKGNTLFIARRSVNTKFFHYPEGVDKPLYGLFESPEKYEEIIICEGIFDALTCYVYNKPAIALMGLGTQKQYEQLKKLKCRKIITALDPDEAGEKATQKIKDELKGYKIVTSYKLPKGKDINNLTEQEFNQLKEIF